ncbi:coniferyl aldehyde dehydrogenase [Halomonas sp. McH1-25]|uniref:coniferyl aldehyde dehydrogenase n=1 Tax=unclassified Halomonas TaxID=2609666 RepID=UPI001EF55F3C|nr:MULTISPECIES: coniferyl aldehyde dehydrogenase [unclassified Halomonas]MCG7600553.1 coniferyl aldehyde dehydrogenase [Halomonas sp. McH1-25]MCP1342020.1 coniferyl aldehyde dehydrogenase [Halomonas sp. FL8]MCP1361988.1 coniferyl aldehyde dehydrogenase [Halomonas sp. BBD45]
MTMTETVPTLAGVTSLQRRFAQQQAAFRQAPYPTLATRRDRLARLERMTLRHTDEIERAIRQDYGHRSSVETRLAEITTLKMALRHTRRHLKRWMRPQRVALNWRFLPARGEIHRQPLGVVGIISPWNYPWQLALLPALSALAAGNRVMIKPSELTPATSRLMAELAERYFDEDELCVITGDRETGKAFASLPFDHLFFTGSTQVGRQVAQSAAANLTPVTLELGGKSPAIVADDADLDEAAQRIAFGKWLNAGQTCIAPDYVLVSERRLKSLTEALERTVKRFYPRLAGNDDYTAIISRRHRQRLIALRDDAENRGCRVIEMGANAEQLEASGKLPPTLVINPHDTLTLMQEEIFGPLLPIIGVKDDEAAIDYVNRHPRPLALYAFTRNAAYRERLMTHTHSGGMAFNDTLLQAAQDTLPFGGIGQSGIGAYHGEHGFVTFSHERSVFHQARRNMAWLMQPPYRRWLMKLLRVI